MLSIERTSVAAQVCASVGVCGSECAGGMWIMCVMVTQEAVTDAW